MQFRELSKDKFMSINEVTPQKAFRKVIAELFKPLEPYERVQGVERWAIFREVFLEPCMTDRVKMGQTCYMWLQYYALSKVNEHYMNLSSCLIDVCMKGLQYQCNSTLKCYIIYKCYSISNILYHALPCREILQFDEAYHHPSYAISLSQQMEGINKENYAAVSKNILTKKCPKLCKTIKKKLFIISKGDFSFF